MIKELRDYIAKCPYIKQLNLLLINYLSDNIKACSINEEPSYNPILNKYLNGYKECQFRFNLDCKFIWSEDIQSNIDNSEVFENFTKWLEEKDNNEDYPKIEGIDVTSIQVNSNGYIYMTETNEAIYRINCVMNYGRY